MTYNISIQNIGGFAIPFDIKVTYADGTTHVIHETPTVWKFNQKAINIQFTADKPVTSMVLDGGIYMDAKPSDNSWNK